MASTKGRSPHSEDLTDLLKTYMNAEGEIEPDKAPADMRDLLIKLQEAQKKTQKAPEGITVTPEPGFVIKTAEDTGTKFFINVCGSTSVSEPGGWKNGQMTDRVREALDKVAVEDPGDVLRFPLSLGPIRDDRDRSGERCHVLDIVFNSSVLSEAQVSRKLKIFLIELAMAWASERHSVKLKPEWKLPKMRYKGDEVMLQMLQLERKPLVEEVDGAVEEPAFPLVAEKKAAQRVSPPVLDPAATPAAPWSAPRNPPESMAGRSEADLSGPEGEGGAPSTGRVQGSGTGAAQLSPPRHRINFTGRPVEHVDVCVDLDGTDMQAGCSHADIRVDVHVDEVFVHVPGHAQLHVSLPFGVDAYLGTAHMIDDRKQLLLRLPFKPYRSFVDEERLLGDCEPAEDFDVMNCSLMQMDA